MSIRCIAIVTVAAIGCVTASARGDVVTFSAANDSTLFESPDGSLAGGKGEYLFVGKTLINQIRRTVLRFDVAAHVPAGAVIDSAVITLHMSRTPTTGTDVSFFRLTQEWSEGLTDPPGEEGAGGITVPGDVTWIHTTADTSLWNTPGGDFAAAASASAMVFGVDFYTWDLTADAQNMLDTPSFNYGWCLIGEEGAETTAKRFDSRENSVVEFRPSMRVDYHLIPAPGFAGVPLLLLWGARRRNRQFAAPNRCNPTDSRPLAPHI